MKSEIEYLQDTDMVPILDILAVLGQADSSMLLELLGLTRALYEKTDRFRPISYENLQKLDFESLTRHPDILKVDNLFTLPVEKSSQILAKLEKMTPDLYQALHEQIVTYLSERLCAGDVALEQTFTTVFNRLASRILSLRNSDELSRLIKRVQDVPLSKSYSIQLRAYFEGEIFAETNRHAEAISRFDILLEQDDLHDEICARILNSKAITCRIIGKLEEAKSGYQASLNMWQKLDNRYREGQALLNLGILAYEFQDYEEAKTNFTQAERCFEESGTTHGLILVQNELGLVCRDQGNWSEALIHFNEAAIRCRADNWPDMLGRILNNIGEVHLFQGALGEAASAFQEALLHMETRVYAVDVYLNLGLTYQVMAELSKAKMAFEEALNLALTIERRDILAQVYYHLGDSLRRLGDDEGALAQLAAGVKVIEETREPLQDEGLKISLLGRWQQVYEALVLHLLALGRPAEAFHWAERVRARAFADAVGSEIQPSVEQGCTTAQTQVAALSDIQRWLQTNSVLLSYFTTGVLENDLPFLRALPEDSPLREHFLTPARTTCFVITRDSLSVAECPLNPNVFASASPRRGDVDRYLAPPVLAQMQQKLVAPTQLTDSVQHLYLMPHGPLHHIPFAAVMAQTDRPVSLSYAPSGTILSSRSAENSLNVGPGKPGLAIGYDGEPGQRALRHTEAEATFVAELIGGEAWTGARAIGEALRAAVSDQQWLHFACHGWFNYEKPLESYLEIGPDERLTAAEILETWQLRAQLVTLSACQTGVSRILRGDEPMGLMRAFLSAGAKSVLVTQWPVEDLPTFLLMQHFYQALQDEPTNPALALQMAQTRLRHLTLAEVQQAGTQVDLPANLQPGDHPFAHPRYWAAFILVG